MKEHMPKWSQNGTQQWGIQCELYFCIVITRVIPKTSLENFMRKC